MHINRLDHLVLTVADVERSVEFYVGILGMTKQEFDGRVALHFGTTKINLHPSAHPVQPHAERPTPGSGDLCLIVDEDLNEIRAQLAAANVPIEIGPADRSGAMGDIKSVYIRDPDQNLIELSSYK